MSQSYAGCCWICHHVIDTLICWGRRLQNSTAPYEVWCEGFFICWAICMEHPSQQEMQLSWHKKLQKEAQTITVHACTHLSAANVLIFVFKLIFSLTYERVMHLHSYCSTCTSICILWIWLWYVYFVAGAPRLTWIKGRKTSLLSLLSSSSSVTLCQ